MKQSFLLSVLSIGLLFASCKKSSNSPGYNQPSVNYRLTATNTSYAVARTTATANIVWTSAIAYPDKVKFEATQNSIEATFTSTNTAQIDLMAPVALTFGNFTIPPGVYNQISIKIDLDKTGSTPILQLNGNFTFGSFSAPVSLAVTQSIELTTDQHNVTISNDSSYTAVTTLDLSAITTSITADMLLNAQLSGGTIFISADSNRDLYDIVLDHLQHENHHCEFEHHHE